MSDLNMRLDFIEEAAHFRTVIARMSNEAIPVDEVENMMWQYMMKKLKSKQLALLSQGLNGINPGYAMSQTNPIQVAQQLIDKALEKPSE